MTYVDSQGLILIYHICCWKCSVSQTRLVSVDTPFMTTVICLLDKGEGSYTCQNDLGCLFSQWGWLAVEPHMFIKGYQTAPREISIFQKEFKQFLPASHDREVFPITFCISHIATDKQV